MIVVIVSIEIHFNLLFVYISLTLLFDYIYSVNFYACFKGLCVMMLEIFIFTDFKCIIEGFSKPGTILCINKMAYRVVLAEATDCSRKKA